MNHGNHNKDGQSLSLPPALVCLEQTSQFESRSEKPNYNYDCDTTTDEVIKDLISSIVRDPSTIESLDANICKLANDLKTRLGNYFVTNVLSAIQKGSSKLIPEHSDKLESNFEFKNDFQEEKYQLNDLCCSNHQQEISRLKERLDTFQVQLNKVESLYVNHSMLTPTAISSDQSNKYDSLNNRFDEDNCTFHPIYSKKLSNLERHFENRLGELQKNQVRAEDFAIFDNRITELTVAISRSMNLVQEQEAQIKELVQKTRDIKYGVDSNHLETRQAVDYRNETSKKLEAITDEITELSTKVEKECKEKKDNDIMNVAYTLAERLKEAEGSLLTLRENVDLLWIHHENDMSKVAVTRDKMNQFEDLLNILGEKGTVAKDFSRACKILIQNQAKADENVNTINTSIQLMTKRLEILEKNTEIGLSKENQFLYDPPESIVELERLKSAVSTSTSCFSASTENSYNYFTAKCSEASPSFHDTQYNNILQDRSLYFTPEQTTEGVSRNNTENCVYETPTFRQRRFENLSEFYHGSVKSNSSVICHVPASSIIDKFDSQGTADLAIPKHTNYEWNDKIEPFSDVLQTLTPKKLAKKQVIENGKKMELKNDMPMTKSSTQESPDSIYSLQERNRLQNQDPIQNSEESISNDVTFGLSGSKRFFIFEPPSNTRTKNYGKEAKYQKTGLDNDESKKEDFDANSDFNKVSDDGSQQNYYDDTRLGQPTNYIHESDLVVSLPSKRTIGASTLDFFKDLQLTTRDSDFNKKMTARSLRNKVEGFEDKTVNKPEHINRDDTPIDDKSRRWLQSKGRNKERKTKGQIIKLFDNEEDLENQQVHDEKLNSSVEKKEEDFKLRKHRIRPFFRKNRA